MMRHECRWVSESGGLIVSPWFTVAGRIRRLETRPDADYAPTASYDIAVETPTGEDLLQGLGANRSATAAEHATVYVATTDGFTFPGYRGLARFRVTNAGAYKAGIAALVVV